MKRFHHTESFRRSPNGQTTGSIVSISPSLTTAVVVCFILALPALYGQSLKPTDYDVKAAYLYNFGRFVEWPAKVPVDRSGPFAVCVLGQDPFGPSLDATLAGETIDGKAIVAKRISGTEESGDCQILFLHLADDSRFGKIIAELDKKPILTVSDMPQFIKRGGMIQFVPEEQKVRFEVNLTATQHAGLKLSSELLKVATAVKRNRD